MQDLLVAGILWVLIAMVGTYGIFSVMGFLTGNSLGEMLQMGGDRRFYASLVVLVVKLSMGKIAAVFFRKRGDSYKKGNRVVAGIFVFMTLLAMELFWLEVADGSLISYDTNGNGYAYYQNRDYNNALNNRGWSEYYEGSSFQAHHLLQGKWANAKRIYER